MLQTHDIAQDSTLVLARGRGYPTLANAIGLTATLEYPPGVVYPSTEGSGLRVFKFTPMTDCMVLMAATPSQPAFRAVLAGKVMSVMFGVIFAQTGMLALALIQPHTS